MSRTPQLCRHRGRSLAYVTLEGREHYLGPWPADSRRPPPAAQAAYDVLIARWLANGRRLLDEQPTAEPTTVVNEVILAFVKYAQGHYTERTGRSVAETEGIKKASSVLSALFGRLDADRFGPKGLKAVRSRMIELGWSRPYFNKQINRLKRMFRWAVAEEMVSPSVVHGLGAVTAIRKGEPGVRETEPVGPVPVAHIAAALPHMSPQVRSMVELQRLTGMRPGEVCIMRGADLDTSRRVWVYRPHFHKNEHRGQTREVYIGPRAQQVLKPWLRTDLAAYFFSPREAEAERYARRSAGRRTPQWASHMARNATKRKRTPRRAKRDHYDTDSYRRAIEYACKKADRLARTEVLNETGAENPSTDVAVREMTALVPVWSPNRLRHNAATALRRDFGIELARIVLGHSTAFTTEIYAEADKAQAMDAVLKVG
jgi:integrase